MELGKRIVIIGIPGAGKSTLARMLGNHLNLPIIHLDKEYWKPGWVEPTKDEWSLKLKELVQQDHWVMDGNYSRTMESRIDRATGVIALDFQRNLALYRILRRAITGYGKTRADMAEKCPERIDWEFIKYVWNFPYDQGIALKKNIELAKKSRPTLHFQTPSELNNWVSSWDKNT